MDTTNSTSFDIDNVQLLAGIPIEILEVCKVYAISLKEMAQVGTKNFYAYLNILTLDKDDVNEFFQQQGLEMDLTPFQFLLANSIADEGYQEIVKKAFRFFLHEEEITFLQDGQAIVLGDIKDNRIVSENEFSLIQRVLRAQNLTNDDNSMNNPANDKAAEIIAKIKQSKKKIKKQGELELMDLVASLAAKGNGLNITNVWDLCYYAFNDQFKRMQMIEEYSNGCAALMAGAKPEKIKLNHWIRKIQDKE